MVPGSYELNCTVNRKKNLTTLIIDWFYTNRLRLLAVVNDPKKRTRAPIRAADPPRAPCDDVTNAQVLYYGDGEPASRKARAARSGPAAVHVQLENGRSSRPPRRFPLDAGTESRSETPPPKGAVEKKRLGGHHTSG
ncbi:hypothetical protein EVAR_10497_1 [Eumeta japonica]|uniref:Uncharacterized protein n=1 Tax=Eumeta variegata TaxID=151549 RepID=A0A4C1THH6_EUMVA|nr:hypothetical protein EVAR_10497_1 [Eumeta japonica]